MKDLSHHILIFDKTHARTTACKALVIIQACAVVTVGIASKTKCTMNTMTQYAALPPVPLSQVPFRKSRWPLVPGSKGWWLESQEELDPKHKKESCGLPPSSILFLFLLVRRQPTAGRKKRSRTHATFFFFFFFSPRTLVLGPFPEKSDLLYVVATTTYSLHRLSAAAW